jgi:hypothetical protein
LNVALAKGRMLAMKRVLLLAAAGALAGVGLCAQTYSIDWSTIDGGGGTSAGGDYVLEGTIGQPDAGPASSGGDYTLQGGFWPGLIVVGPGFAPTLFIQSAGADVVVSWAPETPGFVLESTENLEAGFWEPVSSGNPVTLSAEGVSRFYRLRRD